MSVPVARHLASGKVQAGSLACGGFALVKTEGIAEFCQVDLVPDRLPVDGHVCNDRLGIGPERLQPLLRQIECGDAGLRTAGE